VSVETSHPIGAWRRAITYECYDCGREIKKTVDKPERHSTEVVVLLDLIVEWSRHPSLSAFPRDGSSPGFRRFGSSECPHRPSRK